MKKIKRFFKRNNCNETITCDSSMLDTSSSSNETLNDSEQPKDTIKLHIITPSARILTLNANINRRIIDIKLLVMHELPDELPGLSTQYRLIRAEFDGVELNEDITLAELKLEDNDGLMLVGKRNHLQNFLRELRSVQAPTQVEIDRATEDVPSNISSIPMVNNSEVFQQTNIQFDLRKVIISLAKVSASIIGAGPYANKLIHGLKQKLINKRDDRMDKVQCLVDMGFSKEKAEIALQMHNNNYPLALEWLLYNQTDDDDENTNGAMLGSQSNMSPSGIIANENVVAENTEALLEIVRIYSHRNIPPSDATVASIIAMGFERSEVLDALKKTCNNKAAAIEWLCGNRTESLVELREGLAADSPVLKSILSLPQVHMSLGEPKIFLTFLSMLENDSSIRFIGGDKETSALVSCILVRYHEEKHMLGLNQFHGQRMTS